MPLHRKILTGFACGALAGLALHSLWPQPPSWLDAALRHAVEPLGRLFLRLLLMAVLPLVVSSLMLGVAEMGDARRLGRVAAKTLFFALLTTSLSVLTGLLFVSVFQPGKSFPLEIRDDMTNKGVLPGPGAQGAETLPAASSTFAERLLALVPENPVKAAASGDFLGVMFFSLLFAVGIIRADPEKTKPFMRWLEGVFDASMAFIELVMRAAPLGVGALALNLTARFGIDLLAQLFGYAAVVIAALATHLFLIYPLLLKLYGGMSPIRFFRASQEAMLTAFATSSSSATLPVAIRVSEKNLGVPSAISRFVLTVGASANQNGTALYEGVTALFLAQCFGVELSLGQQVTVLLMSVLGGIGTAGVPGGSLPMLTLILSSIGVPAEGVLLILGVDRFLDMCRTVLNVTGDLLISVLVSRSETRASRP